jgi:hypothetical protein
MPVQSWLFWALSDSWGKMYIWLPGNGRVKRGNGRSAAEGIGSLIPDLLPITDYLLPDIRLTYHHNFRRAGVQVPNAPSNELR